MHTVAKAVASAVAPLIAGAVVQRLAPQDAAVPHDVIHRKALEAREIANELLLDDRIRAVAEHAAKACAKPWWQSKGVWGGIAAAGGTVLSLAGSAVLAGDVEQAVVLIGQIVGAVGGLVAIVGRIVARTGVR